MYGKREGVAKIARREGMRNDNEKEMLRKELKLTRGRDHKIPGANMFSNRSLCSHHCFKHTARGKKT